MGKEMLEAALRYRQMGISVFPVNPRDKKPAIASWLKYQKEYPTVEEITNWYGKMNHQGIAIVTGKLSNIFVIDLDKHKADYSQEKADELIPDSLITPTAKTLRGGEHIYFNYPDEDITIGTGIAPGIDYRGEGGYVVAPPTKNNLGHGYEWLIDISTPRAALSSAFIRTIINNSTLYRCDKSNGLQSVTAVTTCDIWGDGTRDENLFHVAFCLAKQGNDRGYIFQTLTAIMKSWGEYDEKWINVKIDSALDRLKRKDRNLQSEVDSFIAVTDGDFSVTEAYRLLQVVTKEDKATVRAAFHRRKDKTIERIGPKDGVYRRIDTEVVHIDFNEEQGAQYPVLLPLELHSLVNICEGNIVLISGEYNAGKTTFALNTLQLNKNRVMIRYISSEMKAGEFKSRWRTFKMEDSFWLPDDMTQYVELRNNLQALILPDALNIVDYLEFRNGDYTQGAEYMRQIHDKLNKGIVIVCNQQKEGVRLPRSGDLILEKPRLAVTFRKLSTGNEEVMGIAEILKAKNVSLGKMDGKKLKYQLLDNGSRFKTLINWSWGKM